MRTFRMVGWFVLVGLGIPVMSAAQAIGGSVADAGSIERSAAVALVTVSADEPTPATAPEPVWIRHEGLGFGTLDGVPFGVDGRVQFVLMATSDLADREAQPDVYTLPHHTAVMTIEGIDGPIVITTPTQTFVNNRNAGVGFGRNLEESQVMLFTGPYDVAFETWDMTTPIGPITDVGLPLLWHYGPMIETDRGILAFDELFVEIDPATFQMWTQDVFSNGFEDGTLDAWAVLGTLE